MCGGGLEFLMTEKLEGGMVRSMSGMLSKLAAAKVRKVVRVLLFFSRLRVDLF